MKNAASLNPKFRILPTQSNVAFVRTALLPFGLAVGEASTIDQIISELFLAEDEWSKETAKLVAAIRFSTNDRSLFLSRKGSGDKRYLSAKAAFTRYFLRAATRSTPLGLFGSVGTASFQHTERLDAPQPARVSCILSGNAASQIAQSARSDGDGSPPVRDVAPWPNACPDLAFWLSQNASASPTTSAKLAAVRHELAAIEANPRSPDNATIAVRALASGIASENKVRDKGASEEWRPSVHTDSFHRSSFWLPKAFQAEALEAVRHLIRVTGRISPTLCAFTNAVEARFSGELVPLSQVCDARSGIGDATRIALRTATSKSKALDKFILNHIIDRRLETIDLTYAPDGDCDLSEYIPNIGSTLIAIRRSVSGGSHTTRLEGHIRSIHLGSQKAFVARHTGLDAAFDKVVSLLTNSVGDECITASVDFPAPASYVEVTRNAFNSEYVINLGDTYHGETFKTLQIDDLFVQVYEGRLRLLSRAMAAPVSVIVDNTAALPPSAPLAAKILFALGRPIEVGFEWPHSLHDRDRPRVKIGAIWIEPAAYHVPLEVRQQIGKASWSQRPAILQQFACTQGIPDIVSVGKDDQRISGRLSDPNTALAFASILNSDNRAAIYEPFVAQDSQAPFRLEGKSHNGEAILPFNVSVAREPSGLSPSVFSHATADPAHWYTLNLFTTPEGADRLICQLPTFLRDHGLADRWFYIRFANPHFHIRLRIELGAEISLDKVAAFGEFITKRQFASEWTLSPYIQERYRYAGAISMTAIHAYFKLDSQKAAVAISSFGGDDMNRLQILTYRIARMITDHKVNFDVNKLMQALIINRDRYRADRYTVARLARSISERIPANFADTENYSEFAMPAVLSLSAQLDQAAAIIGAVLHLSANRLLYDWSAESEMACFVAAERLVRREILSSRSVGI